MACVYILHSNNLGKYYIGSCRDLNQRYHEHLTKKYPNSFTTKADDWTIFYSVEGLHHETARKVEAHIKRMKSSKYIQNLPVQPEIIERLIDKCRLL